MTSQTRHQISDGPSKFDFMLSLLEGKTIEFTMQGSNTTSRIKATIKVRGQIISITKKDQSHESWEITFYGGAPSLGSITYHGEYSTRKRNGFLKS